ncbi:hypothetical protein [Glutamicibacter sp.]|uniref:hypothetical protein n=1 Tax=Glutamicibacter sp. TaxID=1931995 RepID=UPI0028BD6CF8|nr:hypothetical protein [Glutamicibacter sp.]
MALATVSGNLKDVAGAPMGAKQAVILFTLNEANVVAGSGGLRPNAPIEVKPDSDGGFSASLESTTGMMAQAWYNVQIQFLQSAVGVQSQSAHVICELRMPIRVPAGGGTLDKLIDPTAGNGGGGGPNRGIVYVSQTPPPNPYPFMHWLQQAPGPGGDVDPFDPLNTSYLYEWRP